MDWLTFSLSNQPSFLDSFDPSSNNGAVAAQVEKDGGSAAADLSLVGPKLENFLGVCSEPMGRPEHVDVGGGVGGGGDGMYDSDLKAIAAGFLRGYPSEIPQEASEKAATVLQPESKSKAVDTFGQRTSIYRGVTRHRWTGRYEAHLWDNSCRREGQSRKGRQGGYDKEEKAARAYDLAALKYWGPTTTTNFPVSNYEKEMEEMKNMTRQEFVASLRRKSSGFSRGASIYRGVTRHHQHGRWQARIGRVAGNKDLYLGTFSTQEEAAEAYDIAAIKFRGLNAVTNFDMSRYDVKSIASSNLPIGGMSGRTAKGALESPSSSDGKGRELDLAAASSSASFGFAMPYRQVDQPHPQVQQQQQQQQQHDYWSLFALQQQQQQHSQTHNPYFNVLLPSGSVNMDFSANTTATAQGNIGGGYVWNNGDGYVQEQHQQEQEQQEQQGHGSVGSSIPYATPIALGNGYETGVGYGGSWVTPAPSAMHAYPQSAKPNIGLLQTPIFGME